MRRMWVGAILAAIAGLMAMRGTMPKAAIELIKKYEGLRLDVYLDSAGHKTIGYGHKLLPVETYSRITVDQAESLLKADMARIWNAIASGIKRTLTDNQKAAVLSLAFNIGASAFLNSTMLKKLNEGDTAGAAAEFDRWKFITVNGQKQESKGLATRRASEKQIFMVA